jgi:hypothetical protein
LHNNGINYGFYVSHQDPKVQNFFHQKSAEVNIN